MTIRLITPEDKDFVMGIDTHVDDKRYDFRVYTESGYVILDGETRIGTMFHTVLWDNLPFLNFICICKEYRNQGFGTKAILCWEDALRSQGYKMVLVSTQVDENAQHLYRKLGYVDCGGLLLNGTPFDQPMEMFMRKVL